MVSADRPRLRLLHTSDVHIGDEFCPEKRLAGLTAAVDAALAHQVDALLVVGDLFDSARVEGPDVDAALEQLARLTMPTIVTTGNHDCLDGNSIYHRVALSAAGSHLYFLDEPEGRHLVLDNLGLTVWARALVDHHPEHRPLAGYEPTGGGHWQVVLAHGHYLGEGGDLMRSSPIHPDEIAALGCDYLALGHWHRHLDVSKAGVPAFYCGSPSEPGGSYASTNLVTLDAVAGVQVERIAMALGAGVAS